VMADDERDEQATQVGHQTLADSSSEDTAIRQGPPADQAPIDSPAGAQSAAGSGPEAQAKTEVFVQTAQPSEEQQQAAPTPPVPQDSPRAPESPAEADRMAVDAQSDPFNEKPHLYALGAFAGAFVAAQILKRITTGGDD
jgi:hypothetical protein